MEGTVPRLGTVAQWRQVMNYYLYLSGLWKALLLYKSGNNLDVPFIGKTSIADLDTLREMLATNVIAKSVYLPKSTKPPP